MIEAATFAELDRTFPGRDLTINGEANTTMHHMMLEGACAYCGERFVYYPCTHIYKRRHNKRIRYFCKPSCMRAWDADHKTNLDKVIDDLRERITYLELQGKMPPSQRDVKGDIYRMIVQAETRLNTALNRKAMNADDY